MLARWGRIAVLVLLLVLLPAGVVGMLAGGTAVAGFITGIFPGVLGAMAGARSQVRMMLPATAVASGVGAWVAGGWGWVPYLVIVGAVVGWFIRRWDAIAVCEAGIAVACSTVIGEPLLVVWYAVFVAVGIGFGLWVGRVAGVPDAAPVPGNRDPRTSALVLAVGLGLAASAGWFWFGAFAYWVPVALLTVLEVVASEEGTARATVAWRVVGTLVGVAVLVPVIQRVAPAGLVVVIAILLIVTGLAVTERFYWLTMACLTAAIVLVKQAGAPEEMARMIGAQRFWAQVLAVVLLVLGLWAVRELDRRWFRRDGSETPPREGTHQA